MKEEIKYLEKVLTEQRIKSWLSQYKLGNWLGLRSNSGYKRIEQNGNVNLETLLKLSKTLDLDIEIKKGKLFVFDQLYIKKYILHLKSKLIKTKTK